MNKEVQEFQLSPEEWAYLKRLAADDPILSCILGREPVVSRRGITVQLDPGGAEQLRAHLTRILAETGFQSDYSPTPQGNVLEDLIDRFYVP